MALRTAGFKRNILITALAVCHPVQGPKRCLAIRAGNRHGDSLKAFWSAIILPRRAQCGPRSCCCKVSSSSTSSIRRRVVRLTSCGSRSKKTAGAQNVPGKTVLVECPGNMPALNILTLTQLKHILRAAPVVADDAPVAQTEP